MTQRVASAPHTVPTRSSAGTVQGAVATCSDSPRRVYQMSALTAKNLTGRYRLPPPFMMRQERRAISVAITIHRAALITMQPCAVTAKCNEIGARDMFFVEFGIVCAHL